MFNTNGNGWQTNVTWDLGTMTGIGHSVTLTTGYLNFGQNFYPPYGAAEPDILENDNLYPGNAQGLTVGLSFNPSKEWTVSANYFTGNNVSNGQGLNTYQVGVTYNFAQNATILFQVIELKINSVEQFQLYRAQIDYSF